MQDERTEHPASFGERLVSVEAIAPDSLHQLQQELHAMFVRELTTVHRIFIGLVAVAAFVSGVVSGFLALTESELPILARAGLGTGTLFGLAWTIVAARVCWRGTMDLQRDGRRIAAMVWVFTVLMMVFFLMVGMSFEDRLLGIMMITNGLAFLICAGVYWLSFRIEQAERSTREKLLQLELRLAEFSERR